MEGKIMRETYGSGIPAAKDALRLEEVGYSYRDAESSPVLAGVNATFKKGTMYAITGPSGSGKTTLLSLLAGLDRPSRGRVLFEGRDIRDIGLLEYRREAMALVFQSYNLIDYLTVRENVLLGGDCDADELLSLVGIDPELRNRGVLKLSGGQQQRVAIARALAGSSTVLLADEPTGNLDEKTEASVIEILQRCAHDEGKCVVVVTHSGRVAAAADEVVELERINHPRSLSDR